MSRIGWRATRCSRYTAGGLRAFFDRPPPEVEPRPRLRGPFPDGGSGTARAMPSGRTLALPGLEEATGFGPRGLLARAPGDHVGDLFDALLAGELDDVRARPISFDLLVDAQVLVRRRGNRREVRDAQHLVMTGERAEMRSDARSEPPSHAG